MTHTKKWILPAAITQEADTALGAYPEPLRQILSKRGYNTQESAQAFLNARPPASTDPFQLKDMEAAVDRIQYAVDHGERIAVYGDYDVDGVTATALLHQALRSLDADVRGYIPHRFDEGYGLNNEALDTLHSEGVRLVITVDCGIRSPDEISHARALGLALIITDHHRPADGELPPAHAILDPKRSDDTYPDKDLAGVGIAYKLVQALLAARGHGDGDPSSDLAEPATEQLVRSLLDLVALGTVADLAPLVGENRSLVRAGLKVMAGRQRQGLYALANVAGIPLQKATSAHIGYVLGPRLNAAGRLESATAALELLMTEDVQRAGQLAQHLDAQNRARQALTRTTQEQAEMMARSDDPDAYLLFAAHPEFNAGVVGLAASRLTDAYYRPAVVAATGPEETRGSCRSIPEFNITEALDRCKELLVRHGGHSAAAGFTVRNENLPELISRLKQLAAEALSGHDLRPTMTVDAEIPLTSVRPHLLDLLAELEPTGYGNPDASFVSRDVRVRSSRAVGAEGRHLKLVVEDEKGFSHDVIGFRLGHLLPQLPSRVDLLYSYEINEYNGRIGYQLNLRDLRPAGMED